MPRWFKYSTIVGITLALIAFGGLVISSAGNHLFDRFFPVLLVINFIIAAILFGIVTAMVIRLIRAYTQNQYGSRMTARMAGIHCPYSNRCHLPYFARLHQPLD